MSDYVLEGFKWGSSTLGTPSGEIDWSFATANFVGALTQFDSFLTGEFQTEVSEAFARWEAVANIDFQQVSDSATNDIRLGLNHIDGSNNIVGQEQSSYSNGSELAAVISFDMDEGWHLVNGTLFSSGGASFYDVALHEIGHALGLDHYNVTPAIMNAVLDSSVTDLTQSDVDGVQALYGTASVPVSGIATSTAAQLADGRVDFLQYDNLGHISGSFLTSQPFWKIAGNVDFASNGHSELVTQSNGQIDLLAFTSGELSSSLLMSGTYWDVKGAGAFSGVAGAEFVSQGPAGQIDFLSFDNAGRLTASALTNQVFWNIVGVGDVNGDGHSEVVTQSQSGQIDILIFDHLRLVGSNLLPGPYDSVHDVIGMNAGTAVFLTQGTAGNVTELSFDGSHITDSHGIAAPGLPLVHAGAAAGYFFI